MDKRISLLKKYVVFTEKTGRIDFDFAQEAEAFLEIMDRMENLIGYHRVSWDHHHCAFISKTQLCEKNKRAKIKREYIPDRRMKITVEETNFTALEVQVGRKYMNTILNIVGSCDNISLNESYLVFETHDGSSA